MEVVHKNHQNRLGIAIPPINTTEDANFCDSSIESFGFDAKVNEDVLDTILQSYVEENSVGNSPNSVHGYVQRRRSLEIKNDFKAPESLEDGKYQIHIKTINATGILEYVAVQKEKVSENDQLQSATILRRRGNTNAESNRRFYSKSSLNTFVGQGVKIYNRGKVRVIELAISEPKEEMSSGDPSSHKSDATRHPAQPPIFPVMMGKRFVTEPKSQHKQNLILNLDSNESSSHRGKEREKDKETGQPRDQLSRQLSMIMATKRINLVNSNPPTDDNTAMSDDEAGEGEEETDMEYQTHRRISGWKLTSPGRRRYLVRLMDKYNGGNQGLMAGRRLPRVRRDAYREAEAEEERRSREELAWENTVRRMAAAELGKLSLSQRKGLGKAMGHRASLDNPLDMMLGIDRADIILRANKKKLPPPLAGPSDSNKSPPANTQSRSSKSRRLPPVTPASQEVVPLVTEGLDTSSLGQTPAYIDEPYLQRLFLLNL